PPASLEPRVTRVRIDRLLVERGLVASRERARRLVMAGDVLVGDRPVTKPGAEVPAGAEVRLRAADSPYVSRGGEKLAGALDAFGLEVRDLVALDVGASTGGFTDCLLRRCAPRRSPACARRRSGSGSRCVARRSRCCRDLKATAKCSSGWRAVSALAEPPRRRPSLGKEEAAVLSVFRQA